MDFDPRNAAQRRADRIALFRQELAELEQEGALRLTPEQRSGMEAHLAQVLTALERRFGVDTTDSAKRISWGMRLATLLGGAALVAGVILFLHRIWGGLSGGTHAVLLTSTPLLFLVGAEYTFRCGLDRYYTGLLSVLSVAAFCVGLSTHGNLLNLVPSPLSLLAWGSYALLVAYAYGLPLLLGAGLLLLTGYTAAQATWVTGSYWLSFMEHAQYLLPAAAAAYALPWAMPHRRRVSFDVVYRLCGAFAGLFGLLVFSMSDAYCCSILGPDGLQVTCQILGVLLGAAVVAHGVRLGQSSLVNLGSVAFVIFLYVRLHAWLWDWMPKYIFFFLLGLIAFGLLLVFWRLRYRLTRGRSAS